MTKPGDSEKTAASGAFSEAAKQAQHALDSAKDFVAGADLDQLRTKATDAASSIYAQGRDMLANRDELTRAKDQLTDSIRRNPLAAVGVAFTAGLLLALITRG
jgi:ElaB/YqjD/DUF883 family membrane-anchored ribosome-binding protein